jgi:hypothetical protein
VRTLDCFLLVDWPVVVLLKISLCAADIDKPVCTLDDFISGIALVTFQISWPYASCSGFSIILADLRKRTVV